MMSRVFKRGIVLIFAWLIWGPGACGVTHAQLGTLVQDAVMPTVEGGKEHLLTDATANVIIYFKPGQDFSRTSLKQIAGVKAELAGRPVHWAAVISDRADKSEAVAEMKAAGFAIPVLVDVGDALYGELGVSQLPMVGVCDQQHRLSAYQPFATVNFADVVRARVRFLLKEIGPEELAAALNPAPAGMTDSEEAVAQRRLKLAAKLFEAKSYEKALESVDVSIQRKPTAGAYALRGEILAAQGKCAEAASAMEQARKMGGTVEGVQGCGK